MLLLIVPAQGYQSIGKAAKPTFAKTKAAPPMSAIPSRAVEIVAVAGRGAMLTVFFQE